MQSHEQTPREEPQTRRPAMDEDLARRLDRLSREDAERVLERAIRIQSQRHASETFTPEQIRRIAGELGVDDAVVDRAIREEVTRAPQTEEGKGWLLPARLVDRTVVEGTTSEVDERIASWMEVEEGLRPVTRTATGLRWEPDKHWLTSTRLALGTEGTKALRGMPQVIHHQTAVGPGEQMVELEVDSGRILKTAVGVGAGTAVVGVASGAIVAAAVPGWNDLAQFASVAVPTVAVGAAVMVTIAKGWATSVRKGMSRALSGIAHPELHKRARRRQQRRSRRSGSGRQGGFQRLVDEVSDAIDDLFD